MKYTIICPVYPPEPVVSAATSRQIAEKIRADHHDVTVITAFPNRPEGKLYAGYTRKLFQKETDKSGIQIVRCFSTLAPSSEILSRLLENLSFGFTSGIRLLFSSQPDLVYSNSWPIFATGLVALVCKIRRIPYVISVQDIYPESLLIQGRLKSDGIITKILYAIDRWIVSGSKKTILISDEFAEIYAASRKLPANQVMVVPNWIDENKVTPEPAALYRNERHIDPNQFVLVYGGNVGVASGMTEFLLTLKHISTPQAIVLIIAGSGSQLDACRKIAKEIRNVEVIFHSPWEEEDTSKVLSAADLLILPTHGQQSLFSVPSKLIAYMLSGRPILGLTLPNSSTAKTIEKAACGWVIDPDNRNGIVEKILEISEYEKDLLEKRGANGRIFAMQNFTAKACLPEVIRVISQNPNKLRHRKNK